MPARTALVTGAASGIGRGTALAMAAAGLSVCLVDADATGLGTAAAEAGPACFPVVADASDETAVESAVAGAIAQFGRVDILVNCAGIRGAGKPLSELTLQDWLRRLEVNATSCFLFARAVAGGMVSRGWGRIVNVSSQLALRGGRNRADYCASKAAIHGLTFALARELAHTGVTVNAVAPGPVRTPMLEQYDDEDLKGIIGPIPLGRLGEVPEVVSGILYLAGENSGYTTGIVLNVSGGDVISA